jgi:hypothetical protein
MGRGAGNKNLPGKIRNSIALKALDGGQNYDIYTSTRRRQSFL